jgi:hypothetical protein
MNFAADFKLSISRALTDQLHDALHELERVPLTLENIAAVSPRQGVYQLYLADDLVYVGSAAASLRRRLGQHRRKLVGRQNIAGSDVSFTCLYVDEDLTVLAPEDRLIRVFRDEGSCAWNGNGFGPHDPGRRRDMTDLAANHFDRLYPIRLDWLVEGIPAGQYTAKDLLRRIKRVLPYTYRYKLDHSDGGGAIDVPEDDMSAIDLLRLIAKTFRAYQITALSGYVIMYPESREYPDSQVIKP